MSDNTINRRVFMKKLSSAFVGATALGGSNFFATAHYQREIAINDAIRTISNMPEKLPPGMKIDDLIAGSANERLMTARNYGLMGAWFGGIVGYFQYDWQIPDPFYVEPD